MTTTTHTAVPTHSPTLVPTAVAPAPAEGAARDVRPLRVTVVIGSNRAGRFGPVVAGWLLSRLRERDGITLDVIDVADTALPTALNASPDPDVVAELGRVTPKLAGADAFIVLTPEYNHSYPAELKNLIDWHVTEWQAKPVALVSYGGISGGLRAAEHLRQVFAELHAVTVRDTVSFPYVNNHFDEDGRLRDPERADRATQRMLDQLVWWARALRTARERQPYTG